MLNRILFLLGQLGFNPLQFKHFLRNTGWYRKDLRQLRKQLGDNPDFPITRLIPILGERNNASGLVSGHYFHQDMLVASRIYKNNPARHVDIGSRTDGFVAHVAVFREIEVFDIRPPRNEVENVTFRVADLMQLDEKYIGYTDSLSTLHAIEHFGLGRYGDPIDANGHLKALDNMYRILKPGGTFYFSTPIGPQRIEFNAHRVFSVKYLLDLFRDRYEIRHFSYVDDRGDLHKHVALTDQLIATDCGCRYGCGIFEMTKK